MAEVDEDFLSICNTCGSQYDLPPPKVERCKICDDLRQFVPASGQSWTTLNEIRQKHKNEFHQDPHEPNIWYIVTTPRFGIGQRACLIKSPDGNILWDCLTVLDDETKEFINGHGGLKAIVICHPHWYSNCAMWAKAFNTTIYTSSEDSMWHCRDVKTFPHSFIKTITQDITPSMKIIKLGGHFDGSLVLLWKDHLFIGDTFYTVQAAHTPHPRPLGQHTFAFMWSIVNMIPLNPDTIGQMWQRIKDHDFRVTHGGFMGQDLQEESCKAMKKRVYESMCTQVRYMGWNDHSMLHEGFEE